MNVLFHFSIFPLDKGEHLSSYVARAVRIIKESELPYQLSAMGTTIEGEYSNVMDVVQRCFEALSTDCDRILVNMKLDYKKDKKGLISSKVESVERKL